MGEEGVSFHHGKKQLHDRVVKPTRTAVLCPDIVGAESARSIDARLEEILGLAGAIRLEICYSEIVTVRKVRPATLMGLGALETCTAMIADLDIELVIVDASLAPNQQRNLEEAFGAKVLDRTGLILEIFGERAQTNEGILQVDLAHLRYQRGRLVRSWTHLERQRGGAGFLGGPGETQIESDRRQIQDKIKKLEGRIDKVRKTRDVQRKNRKAVPYPIVALVGYTNAGKSTLFNRLTGAQVFAQDLLFATLDTTVRQVKLPHGRIIVLSDTVGFISDLPHDLVAAFRATLEEVLEADIILHVRDAAHEDMEAQGVDVMEILTGLNIDLDAVPVIEVWNKLDATQDEAVLSALERAQQNGAAFGVSALTGQGIEELLEALENELARRSLVFEICVPPGDAGAIHMLYEQGEVLERGSDENGDVHISVRVSPRFSGEFRANFGRFIRAAAKVK